MERIENRTKAGRPIIPVRSVFSSAGPLSPTCQAHAKERIADGLEASWYEPDVSLAIITLRVYRALIANIS
jgi:hypothetical protein